MSSLTIFCVIMAVYMVLVFFMYREKLPPMWGLMLMGFLVMIIVATLRPGVLAKSDFFKFMSEGATRMAPLVMSWIFAGVFARAQLDTGIVENIVKRAAELGGDRPLVVALLLGLASAYVSVGAFGGGVIVAHLIAFPILVSLGLSPVTAAVIQGFGANISVLFWAPHWAYFSSLTKVTMAQVMPFILIFQPFIVLTWVAFVIYQFKANKLPLRWATTAEKLTKIEKKVPAYALLCPLLPIVFIFVFKVPDHFAFLASAVITIIITQPGSQRKAAELPGLFTRIYLFGISDMAYLVAVIIGIGFILRATDFPIIKAVLGESLMTILPTSAIGFIVFFTVFIALCGLFRGPAMPFAMGGAVYASIAGVGIYPAFLVGALIGTANIVTVVADVTSGQTVYICGLAKISIMEFFRRVYVATLIYLVIGLFIITVYFHMW